MTRNAPTAARKSDRKVKETKAQVHAITNCEITAFESTGKIALIGEALVGGNAAQRAYIKAMESSVYTFGVGPAGTGKTYCEVNLAIEMLAAGKVERIIVTRPAVTADEEMGHLPGELEEKFSPYLVPILEVLKKRLRPGVLGHLLKSGVIEAVPVGFCRGRTFDNAFVIVDEAQNTTPEQMKMLLTRVGKNSVMVINGDPTQKDIKEDSGLPDAIARIGKLKITSVVNFTKKDCMRSGATKAVLDCYED